MIGILKRLKTLLDNPENLIYIAFVSVFLHYVITAAVIISLGIFLVSDEKRRKQCFSHSGKLLFVVFTCFTMLVALYHKNFIGAACSVGFYFIIVIGNYTRSVITEKIFDRCLNICCYVAIPLFLSALVEKVLNSQVPGYTCKLWFFNQNYFCAILATIVLICGYNATSHKGPVLRYYICASFAVAAMYLGKSIFAFIEVFIGLFILLILKRKHLMISVLLFAVVSCLVIVAAVPDIFPRLSEINITTERRIRIWNEAMPFIKENPFFGRGFLSYYQLAGQNPDIYQTTHTHNFALEFLISFGVIGTVILVLFLWSYYRKVAECKELLRNNNAATIILTISSAVLLHMTTDMTLLWIQTGFLYALILGGIGVDEKALNKRILACAHLGGRSDIKREKSPEKE